MNATRTIIIVLRVCLLICLLTLARCATVKYQPPRTLSSETQNADQTSQYGFPRQGLNERVSSGNLNKFAHSHALSSAAQFRHRRHSETPDSDSGQRKYVDSNQDIPLQDLFTNLAESLASPYDDEEQWNSQNTGSLQDLDTEIPDIRQCLEDLANMFSEAKNYTVWALRMVDAWGKPGPGIFHKAIHFLGDYDECLEVVTIGQNFSSRYCLPQIKVDTTRTVVFDPALKFHLGICVPSTCTSDYMKILIDVYIQSLNFTGEALHAKCVEDSPSLSGKAFAAVSICSVLAFIMLVATVYDTVVVRGVWRVLSLKPRGDSVWLTDKPVDDSLSKKQKLTDKITIDSFPAQQKMTDQSQRSEYQSLLSSESLTNYEDYYSAGTFGKILLTFSVHTNMENLLSTATSRDTIECINGLRFISMTWIILGHIFSREAWAMENFEEYIKRGATNWTFQAISNSLVAIDTFFMISGLLTISFVLKELQRTKPNRTFFFHFYLYRFWRMTPPYMLIMMVYITLFRYFGDGPLWPQEGIAEDKCEHSWWTNLFYLNNLVKENETCMPWSWYFAADMQFYVISPIIFLPIFHFGKIGMTILVLMLFGSSLASGLISRQLNLQPHWDMLHPREGSYYYDYYIKPYCRIGPYLVGMVTGYLLHVTECRIRMRSLIVFVGWLLAWIVALLVLYGLYPHSNGDPMSTELAAFYNALHRTAWAAAIGWLIFACATGYGGFINKILSWKGFVPLSRLTYCAYLIHPMVISYYLLSRRRPFYTDDINLAFLFAGTVTISYALAFVASLAFEAPMMELKKVIFGDSSR